MQKREWDRELGVALKSLPRDEFDRIKAYYDELFADKTDGGTSEEEIVEKFGTPSEVAEKILADYRAYLIRGEEDVFSEDTDDNESGVSSAESNASGGAYSGVKKLKFNVCASDVVVKKGSKFSMTVPEETDTRYETDVAGDTLLICEKPKRARNAFGLGLKRRVFTVEIPFLDSVAFKSAKCCFSAEGFVVDKLELSTACGSISVGDCRIRNLSATTASGKIDLRLIEADEASISTVTGDIVASELSAGSLTATTTGGRISLCKVKTQKKCELRSMTGEIAADGYDGINTEIKTFSGGVNVKIDGDKADYALKLSSFVGKTDAPMTGGGKNKLRVSSTSGSIAVSFDR